jgi:hypothetical protein
MYTLLPATRALALCAPLGPALCAALGPAALALCFPSSAAVICVSWFSLSLSYSDSS